VTALHLGLTMDVRSITRVKLARFNDTNSVS